MIKRLFRAYRELPYKKKLWIAALFSPVKTVTDSVHALFFQVYRISDDENAIYITSSEPDINFIRIFYPEVKLEKTRRIFVWSLKSTARRYDKVIIEMHRNLVPFFRDGLITVPFVSQVFTLDSDPENLKQFRKRKKNRLAYTIEVSKDPDAVQFFYREMFVPYIRRRHRDKSLTDPLSKLQYFLKKNGELLLLKKQDQVIGGVFSRTEGDTYVPSYIGLIDDRYLREDAIGALYYFVIVRAGELHARAIDWGDSRPCLLDGVLEYKRKWGGHIAPGRHSRNYLYLKNITKEGLIFFENNKLAAHISRESAKAFGAYSDSGVEVSIAEPVETTGNIQPETGTGE